MKFSRLASVLIFSAVTSVVSAQNSDPVVGGAAPQTQPAAARGARRGATPALTRVTPTPEQLTTIQTKLDQLNAAIKALKDAKADDSLIAEAEVSAHYVGLTLRFPEEFFDQQAISRCVSSLDDGLRRAQEIKDGKPSWVDVPGRVSRAFRSRVDGTPQPYRVIIPASYDKSKPIPLYIYLHGRGDTDLGLGWIGGQTRPANGEVAGPNYIQLQVFGRANNSFRYPGEVDVLEALETVRKNYNIDTNRIVLAGFSMGGAGAYQIGLRNPDMFAGLSLNAGVLGNRRNAEGMTPVQKANAASYGLIPAHAINLSQIPYVGFAGENDAQLAASTGMREQLVAEGYTVQHPSEFVWKADGLRALFLANPKQGHAHPTGETLEMVNAFNAETFDRGRVVPDAIRFATYTTRYNKCYWITVDGMQQHFDRAYIEAIRDAAKSDFTIKTTNVARLVLTDTMAAKKITIDGDALTVQPAASIVLARESGHWKLSAPVPSSVLRKQHNLQGPLNDAFLDSFVCAKSGVQPGMSITDRRNTAELDRFERLMAKEYRGAARIKPAGEITADDIAGSNLILFGDASNNDIIRKIRDRLPIKWDEANIIVGNKTFSRADHVPVFIYPNPLNPSRYVVINSGLVAGGGGNGAGGYGDYAILKLTKGDGDTVTSEIAAEGVFDESWKLPEMK